MENLDKVIKTDEPQDLSSLLNNGNVPNVSMQSVAEKCVSYGSYKCLAQILQSWQLSSAGLSGLAEQAKQKNDAEAYRIAISNMSVKQTLGILNFAPEQYELALRVVEKLSQRHRFIQGFLKARQSSVLAKEIQLSPFTLNSNTSNPYEGDYFPGREDIVEDVCGKVCFPGGLDRNIICFSGREHSGKTTLVKKIATLSAHCKKKFDGILLVEANNVDVSNVEQPIKQALEALTGDPNLEQLTNGVWLLAFILNSTKENKRDSNQSQAIVKFLDSLVSKSDRKLRVVLRVPHVVDIDFMKSVAHVDVFKKISELSQENFDSAVDSLLGRKRTQELSSAIRNLPKTPYFITQIKNRGQEAISEIRGGKGEFVEEIGTWHGGIREAFSPPVLNRTGSAFAVTDLHEQHVGSHGYYRSSTMPNLYNPERHQYGNYSPNFAEMGYGTSMGMDEYIVHVRVTVPEFARRPESKSKDFLQCFEVGIFLMVEQGILRSTQDFDSPFLQTNDAAVFLYSIKTNYGNAAQLLRTNPQNLLSDFLSINPPVSISEVFSQCLNGLRVEVFDPNPKSTRRGGGYEYGYDGHYQQHHSTRSNPRSSTLSPYARSENFNYDQAYSPNMQYSPNARSSHGGLSLETINNARKKKKSQNRSNSKNYRARQDLVQTKRQAVKKLLGDRLIGDEKMIYLRGPKVLFIPSKSPNSLAKIADFVKEIDEDPNVTILRAALPLSRKNEFQLKGFLAYLELESEQQVAYVRKEIYEKSYKEFFQKCVAAEFKKSFKSDKATTGGGIDSEAYTPGDTPGPRPGVSAELTEADITARLKKAMPTTPTQV